MERRSKEMIPAMEHLLLAMTGIEEDRVGDAVRYLRRQRPEVMSAIDSLVESIGGRSSRHLVISHILAGMESEDRKVLLLRLLAEEMYADGKAYPVRLALEEAAS
jgi:hypothetical protein